LGNDLTTKRKREGMTIPDPIQDRASCEDPNAKHLPTNHARNWAVSSRSRMRNASFALICLVIGLLFAEGLVRLYSLVGGDVGQALAERNPLAVRISPHGDYGYRQRANYFKPYPNGTRANWNSMAYRGPEVDLVKQDGIYRIVLLGGSTTHGYGVDDHMTIDAHMRSILAERHPGREFEVVSLSMAGYDSYQLFERMRTDGVRFAPDLVIINSGINDVRNSPFRDIKPADPRTLMWQPVLERLRKEARNGGPSLWSRLRHYSYLARLPGFIKSRMSIRPRVEAIRRAVPHPDAIEYFAVNISETAELARSIGADMILSTPASSLSTKYHPDDVSNSGYWVVNASTTESYRELLAERLRMIAAEFGSDGRSVPYLSHDLPADLFLDDCHLTGQGNRALAHAFVGALEPLLPPTPIHPTKHPGPHAEPSAQ
jgi:lysophospholipase L1-like esterase